MSTRRNSVPANFTDIAVLIVVISFGGGIGVYLHLPRAQENASVRFLRARIGMHSFSMSRGGTFVYATIS